VPTVPDRATRDPAARGRRRARLPRRRGPRSLSKTTRGPASRIDRRELAAIFAGGAVGALARVWIGRHLTTADGSWPWATFAINLSGSFALAYFATRLQERLPLSTYRRPLLGTGFCGAYTTFSTMQVEILEIVEAHRYGLAIGYACASIAAGLAAIWLATTIVRRTGVSA
jgi:fluoride exporter